MELARFRPLNSTTAHCPTAAAIVRLPHGLLGSLVVGVLVIFERLGRFLFRVQGQPTKLRVYGTRF
jgi:hypothetical protein